MNLPELTCSEEIFSPQTNTDISTLFIPMQQGQIYDTVTVGKKRVGQLTIYPSHPNTIGCQWKVAQIGSEACIFAYSFVACRQTNCPDTAIRAIGCRHFLEPPGTIKIDQQRQATNRR